MADEDPTAQYLTGRWRDYYRRHPVPAPDRFGRREFGFIFFGKRFFLRHLGFQRMVDFERFMAGRAPAHAYYSTAFYQDPMAPRMAEKGWLGAELIFDLDADHVPGSQRLPYAEQLAKVKEHFVRLVDDFLVRDFGFTEKEVLLTFSGGRGYHAHVLNERAIGLTAPERREIVDYITATRIDVEAHLVRESAGMRGAGEFQRPIRSLRIAPGEAPGWGGRLNRFLVDYLRSVRSSPTEERVARLEELSGVGRKRAVQLAEELARLDLDRMASEGYLSQGSLLERLLPSVLSQVVVPLAKGETDEPVTSDTKRLIRLPGSLHGKTGLRVVTLGRDELEAFDPLVDAVAFGEEPVTVRVTRPLAFEVAGAAYDLKPDGSVRLPEAAAVMALARGHAVVDG